MSKCQTNSHLGHLNGNDNFIRSCQHLHSQPSPNTKEDYISHSLSRFIYLAVIWLPPWWETLKPAWDPKFRPFWPSGICDTAVFHPMDELSHLKIRLCFKIRGLFERKVSWRIPAQMSSHLSCLGGSQPPEVLV